MQRIIASFLCLLFLLGNIGLSKAAHFCGGLEVMSTLTFTNQDIDCGMKGLKTMSNCTTNSEGQSTLQTKNCCKDTFTNYKIDSEYHSDFNLENTPIPTEAIVRIIDNSCVADSNENKTGEQKAPPLQINDRQILFQSFLI
ncbi:hypothetical protein GYB57_09440 [bacterium]|nr:hypothetical protein [bacterium]